MNTLKSIMVPAALAAVAAACTQAPAVVPTVEWSMENGHLWADSTPAYVQTLRIYGLPDSADRVAFNMFARKMQPLDEGDSLIELVPGYYAVASPRIAGAVADDTVTIRILTRGVLRSVCYAPDGFHGVSASGRTFGMALSRMSLLDDSTALASQPDPEAIYARNEELLGGSAGVYDVVPSFKRVTLTGDSATVDFSAVRFVETPALRGTEAYTVSVQDGGVTVAADSSQWRRLQKRLEHWFGSGERRMPRAEIYDAPDFPYRGVMIDVCRNFVPAGEMHRILDLMALYGLNTLHFHLTDDEAWRLEVQALPELTATGSRRGYVAAGSERGFLPQIFAGNGDPEATAGTANGYYSRADMAGILRHADSLGIRVIPEIESPGHARAAIVALRDNPRYRLDEPADSSVYTSAQAFHDNVMNPALPGPYRLMETVVDELIAIYGEAGVPLEAVHIGGDEVPSGAWGGSPAVNALKDSLGVGDDKAIHAHFVSRVADMIASKGLRLSGWQEVALRHPEDYNRHLLPKVYSIDCWSTVGARGRQAIADIGRAGFPTVLSNVEHFYLDMCYSPHPDERGLSWGGYVDEFDALHGYPAELAPGLRPIGIGSHIFGETIRSEADMEVMLLPKVLGMAERAWNADTTYTDGRLNALIAAEHPKWAAGGLAYHVRQPGMRIEGDRLLINSSYPDPEIYISTDGTNPDRTSTPVTTRTEIMLSPDVREVRAIQYVEGRPSVVTVLKR